MSPLRAYFVPGLLLLTLAAGALPGAIDLKGAYRSALEKSESVQIERAKVTEAEERKSQATGAIYPQLSLNGKYTRQDTGPTPVGATTAFTSPDQYSVSVGATQALFRGLSEFAEVRRRDVLVRAEQAEELRLRQSLYLLVAQRFYAVLAAQRDLATLHTLSELTNKRLTEIRQRVRIGRSRQGELLSSESQASTLQAQLTAADNEVTRAREALRVPTLLPLETALADPGDKLPGKPAPLETWLAEAKVRPDLQALDLQRAAADELVSVAKGGHLPSLDAGANYYLARTGVLANSKWDVTLNLSVPLFRGGTLSSTVGEAVEVRKQAELGLAYARREADSEVRNGHARLVSLSSQVQTLRRASELAEKNYKTQNSDYRLGLVTNLEVISALNTFQESKRVYDKTYFETWNSLAALEAAAGKAPQ